MCCFRCDIISYHTIGSCSYFFVSLCFEEEEIGCLEVVLSWEMNLFYVHRCPITTLCPVYLYLTMALWPLWSLAAFSLSQSYTQSVGPLVRASTRRKAATYTRNNTNTGWTHTDIHDWSGIRTHDPSVRADEDGSCFRSRTCYRDGFTILPSTETISLHKATCFVSWRKLLYGF
jgi:hypothetical protein